MKIKYEDRNFHNATLLLFEQVNSIIKEYQTAGYTLTLRQVYYQLVTKNFIENTGNNYKNIGSHISDGRKAGLIDWEMIEDRTREFHKLPSWETPAQIIQSAASQYRRDLWEGQKNYCEVWTEKEALIAVIEKSAFSLDCPCFACRGYSSTSALWEAANRFIDKAKQGMECKLFYLGDHDPSGQDMTRDIGDRLSFYGATVKIERIALNMDQIRQYNPPPQPVKTNEKGDYVDTRGKGYVSIYGKQSWELDALRPEILDALITDAIKNNLDQKKYNKALNRQKKERQKILKLMDSF